MKVSLWQNLRKCHNKYTGNFLKINWKQNFTKLIKKIIMDSKKRRKNGKLFEPDEKIWKGESEKEISF